MKIVRTGRGHILVVLELSRIYPAQKTWAQLNRLPFSLLLRVRGRSAPVLFAEEPVYLLVQRSIRSNTSFPAFFEPAMDKRTEIARSNGQCSRCIFWENSKSTCQSTNHHKQTKISQGHKDVRAPTVTGFLHAHDERYSFHFRTIPSRQAS